MPVKKQNRPPLEMARGRRVARIKFGDPQFRARFEKELRVWKKKGRPLKEAARASERLTQRDFAVRINARG